MNFRKIIYGIKCKTVSIMLDNIIYCYIFFKFKQKLSENNIKKMKKYISLHYF